MPGGLALGFGDLDQELRGQTQDSGGLDQEPVGLAKVSAGLVRGPEGRGQMNVWIDVWS